MKTIAVIFLIFASVWPGPPAAPGEGVLDLETLIEEARSSNPGIEAARQRYEAARARIEPALSLSDPGFNFTYDKMTLSREALMEGDLGPMRVFGVSQEIPFPTKLIMRRQVAVREAQMAYEDLQEKENEVIARVKTAYANLALIEKKIEIARESKSLLEQIFGSASESYAAGKGKQRDVLRIQLEVSRIDGELIRMEGERQSQRAKLNLLLNRDPETELARPLVRENPPAVMRLPELYRIARQNRPELRALHLAVERAQRLHQLARQEYLPDFTLRYEAMEKDGHLSDWAGMIGITLPLWFWQKQNFNVREMAAELKAMEAELKERENRVSLEVREAFSRVEALNRLVLLYRTAYLPQAEASYRSALAAYEVNRGDVEEPLTGIGVLLDLKQEYYAALTEGEVARADLEMAVGRFQGGGRGEGGEEPESVEGGNKE
ncbi:MAG: TolC family protein [PVC group bacterium]